MRALVTGGAGFIGSHLVDGCSRAAHEVRVLDSLDPQVHGGGPDYLNPRGRAGPRRRARPETVRRALEGVDRSSTSRPPSASASRCTRSCATRR